MKTILDIRDELQIAKCFLVAGHIAVERVERMWAAISVQADR